MRTPRLCSANCRDWIAKERDAERPHYRWPGRELARVRWHVNHVQSFERLPQWMSGIGGAKTAKRIRLSRSENSSRLLTAGMCQCDTLLLPGGAQPERNREGKDASRMTRTRARLRPARDSLFPLQRATAGRGTNLIMLVADLIFCLAPLTSWAPRFRWHSAQRHGKRANNCCWRGCRRPARLRSVKRPSDQS